MMRAIERPVLVLEGEAQTMPGQLWTRVYPDGEQTTFLFDSLLEAQTFARHWDCDLTFDMPPVVDPRRALDYQNIKEALHVPKVSLRDYNGEASPQRHRTDRGFDFDGMNDRDFVGCVGGL